MAKHKSYAKDFYDKIHGGISVKTILKEYLDITVNEKEKIWNQCIFIFDADILLNLYRYTNKTRDLLLAAMQDLKDRIWLPYNIAEEFLKNRLKVFYDKENNFLNLEGRTRNFVKECCSIIRLDSEDHRIQELEEFLKKWVDQVREDHLANGTNDKVLENILRLYDGRIGLPYDEERISEIKSLGDLRYKKEVPPGYKDNKKQGDISDSNRYGDLIIWEQMLDYSKMNKCNIVFVTQDMKEDWWLRISGKTVGPRYELRKEFYELTNMEFNMYNVENFMQIQKHIGSKLMIELKIIDWEDKYGAFCGYVLDSCDTYAAQQIEDGLKKLLEMKSKLLAYDNRQMDEQRFEEAKDLNHKISELQNYLEMFGIGFRK